MKKDVKLFLEDIKAVMLKHDMHFGSGCDASDDTGLEGWIEVIRVEAIPKRWPVEHTLLKIDDVSPSAIDYAIKHD